MHIALLYSAEHSGHAQAAHALKEALQAKDPSLQISEIDLIRKIYPFLGPLVAKAYLEILKQTPLLWETLWNNPSVEEATQEVRDLFHSMDGLKLQGILNVLRPDALVCTHALPCATLAKAKQRGRLGIPLIGVLTDFWAHSYWPCAGVDLYLTPTEEVRSQFLARKIPDSNVQRTGIPLRSPFSQRIAKPLARTKLALDPERPTVLL
ncbi:MAG: hypothetical protein HY402_02705, partial [Elusimicrobia bacterium]|nr:hypothetical protein [Elusimicrobiota bacterium]